MFIFRRGFRLRISQAHGHAAVALWIDRPTGDRLATDHRPACGLAASPLEQGHVMSTNVFLRDDGVEINTRADLAGSLSLL
jgi:hypothetical protein